MLTEKKNYPLNMHARTDIPLSFHKIVLNINSH